MEIVYIKGTPFGKFYYDPKTHNGIAVPDLISPVILGMKEDYNPYDDPDAVRLDVKEEAFKKLHEAACKRDSNLVDKILAEDFKQV